MSTLCPQLSSRCSAVPGSRCRGSESKMLGGASQTVSTIRVKCNGT